MPQLVSVRFRFNPKPLWFDPQGKEYSVGTEVLVETERGREVGTIYEAAIQATDKQISKLKSPLKPVIRELTDLDYEHLEVLEEKGRSAMPFFREKIEEYQLDIKPVEVQYIFSGERGIFYFSSEDRVDFRDLVRDLAQHFHVRIDMRQIGARDEAKELGGLAHCGEEFCCARFGGEFQPVSIRMAKEQDLPLNPTKISGACGRLMCCLRYEYEAYKDFKKRAPKKGTVVDTPLGKTVISGYNTPGETMELKLEDGKRLNVPLGEIDFSREAHPCVSQDTIERCATRSMLMALGALEQQLEDSPMGDLLGADLDLEVQTPGSGRNRRRRSSQPAPAKSTAESAAQQPEKPSSGNRRRRRRGSGEGAQTQASQKPAAQNDRGKRPPAKKQERQSADDKRYDAADSRTEKPRPGQRSSGLRKRRSDQGGQSQGGSANTNRSEQPKAETSAGDGRRRRRQRTSEGGPGGNNNEKGGNSSAGATQDPRGPRR
ncbi:MAG: hypothetical protein LBP91_02890 [Coriobacteriales bacterium]|jgi:cell fate regulator YaaT (PSP1 superfamily)|nr:hypothetical protein [Coriobacteriales bacterium]